MTEIQKTIAAYIHGSSGTCYHASDNAIGELRGMLKNGEATEDDFRQAVNAGEKWLEYVKKQTKECDGGLLNV